jgi:predicted permease
MVGLEPVCMLFLLIVLGYWVGKRKIVSENIIGDISALLVNVALPAFIITSMNFEFSMEVLMNSGVLILISFVVYFCSILFSKLYSRLLGVSGTTGDIHEMVCIFSNVGFMGYPVVLAVYGEIGVFYAAMYNLGYNLLIWSYGANLINREGRENRHKGHVPLWDKVMKFFNPSLVAVIIGFGLFLTSTELPSVLLNTFDMVGRTVTPLSMLCIGFILSGVDTKDVFNDYRVLMTSIMRLVIIPLVLFFILKTMGKEGYLIAIPVLITAMPAAANTAIIAVRYKSDYKLASKMIFISTLMSIITIPLMIQLIMGI